MSNPLTPEEMREVMQGLEDAWRKCNYKPQWNGFRTLDPEEKPEENEAPMVRDPLTGEYEPDTNPHHKWDGIEDHND